MFQLRMRELGCHQLERVSTLAEENARKVKAMAVENEKREKNLKDQMVKEAEDFAEENERRIKAMWVESENMEKKLKDQMEERLSQELDKQTSRTFYFERE
jgi:hypothetical protein